ncbi:MAG: DUF4136 domain-containing protein [Deltaproteobacteria bacterium]|nr:DUF4136 domain-containing protein [Deltaproteobacteria bacterium]MBW2386328.1 DUF4136 domain-containing protein [Deltaproteobacteria bacterium]MBW2695758.1 DUF4136 domain-containing protein [Deltaproteobacteria bacterium]
MSMINRTLRLGVLIAVLAFATACSSVPVNQDYDPAYDFSQLGSYAWMERPPASGKPDLTDNQLVNSRVMKAFDDRMATKGHRLTSADQASFLVTHYISVDKKIRVNTSNYGYGYGYRGYGGAGYSDTTVRQYEVGELILDFVSNDDDKKLLWRGTGSSKIQDKRTPEERQQVITKVVDAVLKQFPPNTK